MGEFSEIYNDHVFPAVDAPGTAWTAATLSILRSNAAALADPFDFPSGTPAAGRSSLRIGTFMGGSGLPTSTASPDVNCRFAAQTRTVRGHLVLCCLDAP